VDKHEIVAEGVRDAWDFWLLGALVPAPGAPRGQEELQAPVTATRRPDFPAGTLTPRNDTMNLRDRLNIARPPSTSAAPKQPTPPAPPAVAQPSGPKQAKGAVVTFSCGHARPAAHLARSRCPGCQEAGRLAARARPGAPRAAEGASAVRRRDPAQGPPAVVFPLPVAPGRGINTGSHL
jgi:hypothetical protein